MKVVVRIPVAELVRVFLIVSSMSLMTALGVGGCVSGVVG